MANEARLAAIRKQQRLNRIREVQARNAAPEVVEETIIEEPEVPEDRGLLSDINDRVQAFTQGVTLNSMDELGSAAMAGLKPAINWAAGAEQDDSTYGERYDKYHQQYQDDRERFADENFGEALALEMAGGFLLPGGVAKNAATMSRKAKLLSGMGRGAIEGGIAGTMAADQGERGTGAALGTTIGGALPGAMNLLNRGAGTIARRRIADDISEKPIHYAKDSGTIGDVYRQLLGRVWGAKDELAKQERPFLDAAENLSQRSTDDVVRLGDDIKAEKLVLKRSLEDAKANLGDEGQEIVEKMAVKDHPAFRTEAINDAIPTTMPASVREEIAGLNPREAETRLSKWWADEGFQTVKGRKFEWDGKMKASLRKKIASNPLLLNDIGDKLSGIGNMETLFGGVPSKLAKTASKKRASTTLPTEVSAAGRQVADMLDDDAKVFIDGEALMEMRNVFARPANRGLSLKGKNQRSVADEFDSMMFDQLGDDAGKYADELARWGPKQWVSAATRNAKKGGRDFTPQDWLKVSRAGDTEGRRAADSLVNNKPQMRKLKQAIKRKAKEKMRKLADAGNAEINATERTRAAAAIKKEADDALKELNKRSVPESTSGLSALLTTGLVGSTALAGGLAGGPLGSLIGLGSGIGIGKALAGKGVQKAVAGQTGLQGKIRDIAGNEMTRELARRLRQTTAREAAGRAGEQ